MLQKLEPRQSELIKSVSCLIEEEVYLRGSSPVRTARRNRKGFFFVYIHLPRNPGAGLFLRFAMKAASRLLCKQSNIYTKKRFPAGNRFSRVWGEITS